MRKARLAAFVGALLIRTVIFTLRIRIEDRAGVIGAPPEPRLIWLFWHNRLFLIPWLIETKLNQRKGAALTSASGDGDYLAAFIERFNVRAVRGSSSRRGAAALREMMTLLKNGVDMAITPDGPRGPRYHLNPGVLKLAQQTQVGVMLINVEYSNYWQLKSWDGFMIPKPFCRANITLGEIYPVQKTASPGEFEAERLRLETALNSLRTAG
jgi:lysophospholipid acyltransferase (LPLAT)-like uncharacterized protein